MADAFSPITTVSYVDIPKNHKVYTTTRAVAIETPLPQIGATMAAFLPGALSANIILDAWETPFNNAQKKITVQHTALPSGTFTERESVAYQFPPIYPNSTTFFPGGSYRRARVVLGRVTYEFSRTPATWDTSPAIWDFASPATGPFEVKSFLAEVSAEPYVDGDGNVGTIGEFLAGNFIFADTIHNIVEVSAPGDIYYASPPSAPSATTYASWVANKTEIMVSRTVDDWLGDISMRRTVYVRAQ